MLPRAQPVLRSSAKAMTLRTEQNNAAGVPHPQAARCVTGTRDENGPTRLRVRHLNQPMRIY